MAKFEPFIGGASGSPIYLNVDRITFVRRDFNDEDQVVIGLAGAEQVSVRGSLESVMNALNE